MRSALRHLWTRHRPALVGLIVALAVVAFFVARFVAFSVHWADPDHRRQPPAAWMTPRYISLAWDIPPEEVMRALGVSDRHDRRPTLGEIARRRGVPEEVVLDEVRALIDAQGPE
ncbi:hypothetical protein [Rhodosalinus sp.]|uniref:hypothetical protein n=1 Tax=Rhodosalinus sp. TaxID=2047741 RepID=UPI00356A1C0D